MPARTIGASTSFLPASTGDFILRQRRFDLFHLQRKIARDLVAQQHADLAEELAERLGRALAIAHQREFVLNKRMIDNGDALHGAGS